MAAAVTPKTGWTSATVELVSPETDQRTLMFRQLFHIFRNERNLPRLTWHPGAAIVARDHAMDMELRDFFGHVNPDGLGPGQRVRAAGITAYVGENIASGYGEPAGFGDPARASEGLYQKPLIQAWMDSTNPQHGENLLVVPPQYTHFAAGRFNLYWTFLILGGIE
jgi:uncharacterized protein YkwD